MDFKPPICNFLLCHSQFKRENQWTAPQRKSPSQNRRSLCNQSPPAFFIPPSPFLPFKSTTFPFRFGLRIPNPPFIPSPIPFQFTFELPFHRLSNKFFTFPFVDHLFFISKMRPNGGGFWILLPLFAAILLLPPIRAQFGFQDTIFDQAAQGDPLRKVFGIWGRLLNRMAQQGPPSDDELHLKVNCRIN